MNSAFLAPGITYRDTTTRATCRHRVSVSSMSSFLPSPVVSISPLRDVPQRRLFFIPPRASTSSNTPPPRILIVGAPASGKGTQCKFIASSYDVVHISTGDMLRAAVAEGTDLGCSAKEYMDTGRLVPDQLVTKMLVERLQASDCVERGWLLDGFPRTAAQADALVTDGVVPDAVLLLNVPDGVLVQRVVGRRLDPDTGNIYHVDFNPPPVGEVADRCVQRSDDTEEKARVRIETFKIHAEAVQQRYSSVLASVDGNRDKNVVFDDVQKEIDAALARRNDDNDNDNAATAAASNGAASAPTSGSTLNMPVSEFVEKAEEAYEMKQLQNEKVAWSGQAGMDKNRVSTSDWDDVPYRLDLAIGDMLAFILFAYVGRANHGDLSFGFDTIRTALPFIVGWFAIAPLTGAYMSDSTNSVSRTLMTVLPAWALSIPAGLGLRALATQHLPPTPFVIVSFIATAVVLSGWRVGYTVFFNGGVSSDGNRRGNLLDGFKMVTTLLRRW